MSDPVRLDVAAVAEAAARIAQTRGTAPLVAALLDVVRAWAAPSAVFAAVRDASVEGGWRALPGVVLGSVPVGIERSLGRLAEDAPEALARGGIVQRGEDIAGVRARDNWAVPFGAGDESGALFLRGVPRPAPEDLAEALALVSAAVWPRLVGSPADRVETLVTEVRAAADRLAREAQRQIEALEAHRPVPAADAAGSVSDEGTAAAGVPSAAAGEPAAVDDNRLEALERELRTLEGELQRLATESRDARAEAEMLRGERDALHGRLARAEAAAAEADRLAERLAGAEAAAAENEALHEKLARAEAAAAEADSLRERLAEAEVTAARAAPLAERLAGAEAAAAENEALHEKLARAEAAAAEADSLRERLAEAEVTAAGAAPLAERLARAEAAAAENEALHEKLARAEAAAAEADSLRERLAAAEVSAAGAAPLAERLARAEAAAAENEALHEKLARAEAAAAEADSLRERLAEAEATAARAGEVRGTLAKAEAAVAEAATLADRLETLRRAAEAADVRARKAEEELAAAQRDLAQSRARSGQQEDDRRRRLEEAEARAHALAEQWDAARRALRAATAAVRRAAFLPPAVRVSMEEAVGPDEGAGRAAPPWMGAVLLDRDAVTLESVADALETSGVDVRIAGHSEEVALLLRTADAATLGAVVCDVMAFRSDQNVAGLIRTWERDRPGLTYFLSFDPDSAGEVERARRIPTSIISGHLPRPLSPPRLLETLETLAKRRGKL